MGVVVHRADYVDLDSGLRVGEEEGLAVLEGGNGGGSDGGSGGGG